MAAPPYLTRAAEGFELLPACLILQLVQELQPGSSGSIACILQTCSVCLGFTDGEHGTEIYQQKGRYTGLPLSYGVEKLKIIPSTVSWMDGGHLPLLPGVLCHLQLQRWGEPQLPRAQQSPAQSACGLQENTVPRRVTLSHCDTTSFSSSLAKQYKPCCTLK